MNKVIKYVFVLLSLIVLGSCKRTIDKPVDGKYKPASADFNVLDKVKYADFTEGSVLFRRKGLIFGGGYLYLKSLFNETVSWQVTISAKNSSAIKKIRGVSAQLDTSNFKWAGESDFSFFKESDSARITLTVDGIDKPVSDTTIIINTTKVTASDFMNPYISSVTKTRVLIVDNMELATDFPKRKMSSPYSDTEPLEKEAYKGNASYPFDPIEGKKSFYLEGRDFNLNTYIAGTTTNTLTALAGFVKNTNPDSVYVNVYVRGFGDVNTALNIVLYEVDTLNKGSKNTQSELNKIREATTYDNINNDVLQYLLPVDWVGWKLVSIKYSQFRAHNSQGGGGNKLNEPNKLGGFAFELSSSPNMVNTKVSLAFDLISITEGAPFVHEDYFK